jgi:hypothetical protein
MFLVSGTVMLTLKQSIQDFWNVYHGKLQFLDTVNKEDLYIRTSSETRTHQVAGGLLYGMDPSSSKNSFPLHTQPTNVRVLSLSLLQLPT